MSVFLRSYRLHVATQEGSKGAPLNEALPAIELAKIIYKRRKLKEDAKEVRLFRIFWMDYRVNHGFAYLYEF